MHSLNRMSGIDTSRALAALVCFPHIAYSDNLSGFALGLRGTFDELMYLFGKSAESRMPECDRLRKTARATWGSSRHELWSVWIVRHAEPCDRPGHRQHPRLR